MKKIILFLCFSFCACSSNKIVTQYLANENPDSETIVITDQKIASLMTINTLQGSQSINENGQRRLGTSFISEIDITNLQKRYQHDTIAKYWVKSDFNRLPIELIQSDADSLKAKGELLKQGKRIFYAFSEPILVKDLAFISVSKADGWQVLFSGVIVFRKVDSKWEIFDKVEASELH